MVGRLGFEPRKAWPRDLQSPPFDRFGICPRGFFVSGADNRARTGDLLLTMEMLYQLSYVGVLVLILFGFPSLRAFRFGHGVDAFCEGG